MGLLQNKIALVTGASAGIGKATAEVFAREGAHLIIIARRPDKILTLADELQKNHKIKCHPVALDIRNQEAVASAIANLPDDFKNIDILVNNAGLSRGLAGVHDADLTDWEEMIDTNIKGLLYISRTILPGMMERNRGHVVNIGSVSGHQVYPGGNVYCATKHAVDAITRGMQLDLVASPIHVTAIDPGMVETEFSEVRFHGDKEKASTVYKGLTPLKGEDIAETVLFAVTRPPHINIHNILIMPKDQATAMVANRKQS